MRGVLDVVAAAVGFWLVVMLALVLTTLAVAAFILAVEEWMAFLRGLSG